jgi:rSAM/selenodomain-associated transferase 1
VDRRAAEGCSLGIFAKAPIAWRVKTRLARDIGAAAATALYRRLGRQVVAGTVDARYRTTVWFTPASRGDAVRAWLDGLGAAAFYPQAGGNLGTRLVHAFGHSFADGNDAVVIIGTDAPGVNRRTVMAAFRALRAHDLVLGPSLDGGYYLIGLSAPHPALFRSIPWSTKDVLRATQAQAQALGLTCRLLAPLRDVDSVADARALGLWRQPGRPTIDRTLG